MNGHQWKAFKCIVKYFKTLSISSRVAQWKRAGPITQRSEDQNLALLVILFSISLFRILLASYFEAKINISLEGVTFHVSQNLARTGSKAMQPLPSW